MSCPTCGGTMQRLADIGLAVSIFWCPRCGTTRRRFGDFVERIEDTRPALVGKCREFEANAALGSKYVSQAAADWRRLGIAEAIHRPEERPT